MLGSSIAEGLLEAAEDNLRLACVHSCTLCVEECGPRVHCHQVPAHSTVYFGRSKSGLLCEPAANSKAFMYTLHNLLLVAH